MVYLSPAYLFTRDGCSAGLAVIVVCLASCPRRHRSRSGVTKYKFGFTDSSDPELGSVLHGAISNLDEVRSVENTTARRIFGGLY